MTQLSSVVTFAKFRDDLCKKTDEIAGICGAELTVFAFSPPASPSIATSPVPASRPPVETRWRRWMRRGKYVSWSSSIKNKK